YPLNGKIPHLSRMDRSYKINNEQILISSFHEAEVLKFDFVNKNIRTISLKCPEEHVVEWNYLGSDFGVLYFQRFDQFGLSCFQEIGGVYHHVYVDLKKHFSRRFTGPIYCLPINPQQTILAVPNGTVMLLKIEMGSITLVKKSRLPEWSRSPYLSSIINMVSKGNEVLISYQEKLCLLDVSTLESIPMAIGDGKLKFRPRNKYQCYLVHHNKFMALYNSDSLFRKYELDDQYVWNENLMDSEESIKFVHKISQPNFYYNETGFYLDNNSIYHFSTENKIIIVLGLLRQLLVDMYFMKDGVLINETIDHQMTFRYINFDNSSRKRKSEHLKT
ncbi:MAG: hypothetical protein K940chlam3_00417, partial [Chlamydiae bacterium]|nr:hypothetical protein [Chlamydiota bacterium]